MRRSSVASGGRGLTSSRTVVPSPGRDSIVSSPPTSRARSRIPAIPRPRSDSSKAKPRPSSATVELDPVRRGQQRHVDPLRAAVAGRVRERLLGDAVDDELNVAVEVGEVAIARSSVASIPRAATCSTWPAMAAARPRSSSAVGRSWRASESSSRIAWLASAFVSPAPPQARAAPPRAAPRVAAAGRSATG